MTRGSSSSAASAEPKNSKKRAGAGGVAFACYPTAMDELLAVADAGDVMPPKSTWFEPKLLSGLIVRPLD
ncbi:MAG: hypothetical protein M5R36_17550 [Deltaproteobacteria bacterium]|nr:hypothetical protein [Deltaproteobacteria bacterium]